MFPCIQILSQSCQEFMPQKIVVSYHKMEKITKKKLTNQNCIAPPLPLLNMSSTGACLYEEGGIEGGHISTIKLTASLRLRFHVYMFIPEN